MLDIKFLFTYGELNLYTSCLIARLYMQIVHAENYLKQTFVAKKITKQQNELSFYCHNITPLPDY